MWYDERIKQCERCKHSEHTYDMGDIHEVCEGGHCILCFQTGRVDCFNFEPKEDSQNGTEATH